MAGFKGISDVVNAEREGRSRYYGWRKAPTQVTTIGIWFDLTSSPGNPVAKFWFDAPPLIAKAIAQSTDGGIFHGANVSPMQKVIRKFMVMTTTATALPIDIIVCDYLLYYPTIGDDTVEEQLLDNTVTLPRYTDGDGVMMMAVTLAGRTGGSTFTVNYTNSEGVSGRTSKVMTLNASTAIGSISTSDRTVAGSGNPFIGLQNGDSGVRSIESITMITPDSGGLFALILVKPLFQTQIRGIDAPVEKDLLMQAASLPIVQDDAYISAVCLPLSAVNGTVFTGDMQVVFN